MKETLDFVDFMRLRESRIIVRREPAIARSSSLKKRPNLDEHRNLTYKGYLSKSSCAIIEKRLQCWFNSIFVNNKDTAVKGVRRKFLPVMITLTLSDTQKHDDKYIKKHMLQEFLKALQRKVHIRFTFWKAEAQLNGNIHFHLIIDRYVDKKFIQGLWNYYQKKKGYLDKFYSEHRHYDAPSTHLTGMHHSGTPINYVLKYMQKNSRRSVNCKQTEAGCLKKLEQLNEIRRPIQGRLFTFSHPLVQLTPEAILMNSELWNTLENEINEGKAFYKKYDYCEIIYCKKCKAYDLLTLAYQREVDMFYRKIFRQLYIEEPVITTILDMIQKPPPVIKVVQGKLKF